MEGVLTAPPAPAAPGPPAPTALRRREVTILSPLRYPGGKRRFAGYVAAALAASGLRPDVYAEPFAGGASVGLQLLADGRVGRALFGEKDPLVAAFWRVVFLDSDWLCERIARCTPTLAEWERVRASRPTSDRGKAWKCLFLNRTSFSGILSGTAGPIGGRAQASAFAIGCRFPPATLVRRVRQAAALADRVEVVEGDFAAVLARLATSGADPAATFAYLDPPFFAKADRLYRHFFRERDHVRLRDALAAHAGPFLLSYDAAPEIAALYADVAGAREVELLYTTTERTRLTPTRELVVSNLDLPDATRLWRTASEWRADR